MAPVLFGQNSERNEANKRNKRNKIKVADPGRKDKGICQNES